jgi:hypothetical protein
MIIAALGAINFAKVAIMGIIPNRTVTIPPQFILLEKKLFVSISLLYLPSRMKIPARMARTPITMPRPSKCRLNMEIIPYKISHIDSKIKPTFLIILTPYKTGT